LFGGRSQVTTDSLPTNTSPHTCWTMWSTEQIWKSAEQSSKRAKGIADERTVEVSREVMDDYLIKTSW